MKCPECHKNFATNGLPAHRLWKHGVGEEQVLVNVKPNPVIYTMHPGKFSDPVQIIRRVKQVASEVGGLHAMAELIAALDS
jgi:hypothetical protein